MRRVWQADEQQDLGASPAPKQNDWHDKKIRIFVGLFVGVFLFCVIKAGARNRRLYNFLADVPKLYALDRVPSCLQTGVFFAYCLWRRNRRKSALGEAVNVCESSKGPLLTAASECFLHEEDRFDAEDIR
jgi:hypothetical protein